MLAEFTKVTIESNILPQEENSNILKAVSENVALGRTAREITAILGQRYEVYQTYKNDKPLLIIS